MLKRMEANLILNMMLAEHNQTNGLDFKINGQLYTNRCFSLLFTINETKITKNNIKYIVRAVEV